MIALGMMSGTSLDAIDSALVEIRFSSPRYQIRLIEFRSAPYDAILRRDIEALSPPASVQPAQIAQLHRRVGLAYARAVEELQPQERVDYVAMHGQTVFHDGESALTLQLGSPYFVRDLLPATVCYDFRGADCAVGGHGAPLVPYADALLLGSSVEDRVAVNIGGISNLTYIPQDGTPQQTVAFDTGPGNMLIDAFVQQRTNGAERFDRDGAFAAEGAVHGGLLAAMLEDPYFAQSPPKSTGRERFGAPFLAQHTDLLTQISLEDGAATLTALTTEALARAIKAVSPLGARVFVGGGGARNDSLLRALRERLPAHSIETTEALNLPAEAKEAVAFALLGYETLRGIPANLPQVTGAKRTTVLGSIAPYELAALLQKVRLECAS